MDADDISLPARFEKQIAYFLDHPQCVLLGSRVILVEPFGSPLYQTDHQTDNDPIVAELLSGIGWAVVHPSAMMRADAVGAAGGYRSEFVPIEDLDLFLRLSQLGTPCESGRTAAALSSASAERKSHPFYRAGSQEARLRSRCCISKERTGSALRVESSPAKAIEHRHRAESMGVGRTEKPRPSSGSASRTVAAASQPFVAIKLAIAILRDPGPMRNHFANFADKTTPRKPVLRYPEEPGCSVRDSAKNPVLRRTARHTADPAWAGRRKRKIREAGAPVNILPVQAVSSTHMPSLIRGLAG